MSECYREGCTDDRTDVPGTLGLFCSEACYLEDQRQHVAPTFTDTADEATQ